MCAQFLFFFFFNNLFLKKNDLIHMDTLVVLVLNLFIQLRHTFFLFEMCLNFYRGLNFMVEIRGLKIMSSAVLVNKILFTDYLFIYILPMAAFVLQWQLL